MVINLAFHRGVCFDKVMHDFKAFKRQTRQQAATGTLWLFAGVLCGWLGSSIAYSLGYLSGGTTFCINTLCIYLSFTVLHEASHGNIRGKGKAWRKAETLMGWISGFLLTVPFSVFRQLHLTHHAHTNHPEKDPDYWVASGRWWLVGLKSMSIIVGYYWHFIHFFPRDPNAREKKYVAQSLAGFGAVYAITFLSLFYGRGLDILLLWWGPALTASGFLALGFNWLPHHPHEHQGRYQHTRILTWPVLTPVLLAQNYHLIHHLHPGLPFYLYPRAFRMLHEELHSEGSTILGPNAFPIDS